MANRSNAAQRACCYGIAYRSNSLWLFGLNFGSLLGLNFLWQVALLGYQFLLTPSLVARLFFGNLHFIQILITKYATNFLAFIVNFHEKISPKLFI